MSPIQFRVTLAGIESSLYTSICWSPLTGHSRFPTAHNSYLLDSSRRNWICSPDILSTKQSCASGYGQKSLASHVPCSLLSYLLLTLTYLSLGLPSTPLWVEISFLLHSFLPHSCNAHTHSSHLASFCKCYTWPGWAFGTILMLNTAIRDTVLKKKVCIA